MHQPILRGGTQQIKREQVEARVASSQIDETFGNLYLRGLECHAGFITDVKIIFNHCLSVIAFILFRYNRPYDTNSGETHAQKEGLCCTSP